jgi:hypothetical protein
VNKPLGEWWNEPPFNVLFRVLQQTNLPVFKLKESSVRRRYSDFEWLRNELERDSKVRKLFLLSS